MTKQYRYEIEGTGFGGQTWKTSGQVECEFLDAYHNCMKSSFEQLTNGEAVYGQPGVGCHGPYQLSRILIEVVLQ